MTQQPCSNACTFTAFICQFILICPPVMFGSGLVLASETVPAPTTESNHQVPGDVQRCLDVKRKARYEERKKLSLIGAGGVSTFQASAYTFTETPVAQLPSPGCDRGNLSDIKLALRYQLKDCKTPATRNQTQVKQLGCLLVDREEWCTQTSQLLLKIAQNSSSLPSFMNQVRNKLLWFKSSGQIEAGLPGSYQKGESQFTAYYTSPTVDASETPDSVFRYPVYARPANLVHVADSDPHSCGIDPLTGGKINWCLKSKSGEFTPVPTRAEINSGHFGLKPLYYLKDPVDIAFMMIQGSGKLRILNPGMAKHCERSSAPNCGRVIRLDYDGQNGQPLNLIGGILACTSGTTAQDWHSEVGIRHYIAAHPDTMNSTLNMDPSYVFFKVDKRNAGAIGADGFPVTRGVSLATDRSVLPAGATALISVKSPGDLTGVCSVATSIGLSQDTGGAIVGSHVDRYLGDTAEAKHLASDYNVGGDLFFGIPKGAGKVIPNCKN